MTREMVVKQINDMPNEEFEHAFEMHLDKEDGFLIDRCINEHKGLATTFNSEFEAELVKRVIKNTLINHADVIAKTATSSFNGEQMTIDQTFGTPFGKGFFKKGWHDWNRDGACPCSTLRIGLTFYEDGTFSINSAYPTANRRDIAQMRGEAVRTS